MPTISINEKSNYLKRNITTTIRNGKADLKEPAADDSFGKCSDVTTLKTAQVIERKHTHKKRDGRNMSKTNTRKLYDSEKILNYNYF